jgi:phage tail-like protein
MALPDLDTSVGHSFAAEYDGVMIKAIQEVSGLKFDQDVIELKQNMPDGKYVIKKLPGRKKAGEVTLTRGLTADNSFEKWVEASQFGKMGEARKNGAVIVFDYEGAEIKRYTMLNAWPKTLEIGSMKAGDTAVLTEKLTITYEELTVEGGG